MAMTAEQEKMLTWNKALNTIGQKSPQMGTMAALASYNPASFSSYLGSNLTQAPAYGSQAWLDTLRQSYESANKPSLDYLAESTRNLLAGRGSLYGSPAYNIYTRNVLQPYQAGLQSYLGQQLGQASQTLQQQKYQSEQAALDRSLQQQMQDQRLAEAREIADLERQYQLAGLLGQGILGGGLGGIGQVGGGIADALGGIGGGLGGMLGGIGSVLPWALGGFGLASLYNEMQKPMPTGQQFAKEYAPVMGENPNISNVNTLFENARLSPSNEVKQAAKTQLIKLSQINPAAFRQAGITFDANTGAFYKTDILGNRTYLV